MSIAAAKALMIVTALLGGPAAAVAGPSLPTTEAPAAQVCFPKRAWSASPDDRPCYRFLRPQEDGSGRLIVGTFSTTEAVCPIPNVTEERGRFALHCHRVPR
jgi:hypothetical protein